MNKEVQAAVRLDVERMAVDQQAVSVVATLEVARQIALLTEELRRVAKKNDEMVACVKGILLRMEARDERG